MVDNRGVTPVSSFNFKSGDISGTAAKTSEEKMGQGGEYFAQEMQEEENQEFKESYQDRSAQLRASLNGLAMANAGSIMVMKLLKEKEKKLKNKNSSAEEKDEDKNIDDTFNQTLDETVYDE